MDSSSGIDDLETRANNVLKGSGSSWSNMVYAGVVLLVGILVYLLKPSFVMNDKDGVKTFNKMKFVLLVGVISGGTDYLLYKYYYKGE